MAQEVWLTIFGIGAANFITLISGFINIIQRLTKIETDLNWVKKNCPNCRKE